MGSEDLRELSNVELREPEILLNEMVLVKNDWLLLMISSTASHFTLCLINYINANKC